MDFQILDVVADSYIPLLAVISLSLLLRLTYFSQWALLKVLIINLAFCLVIAYGLMLVDSYFQIWAILELDYSTHMAVSLALVIFLVMAANKYRYVWGVSLVCYVVLMLYQKYHLIGDLISTVLVMGLILVPAMLLVSRHLNKSLVKQV